MTTTRTLFITVVIAATLYGCGHVDSESEPVAQEPDIGAAADTNNSPSGTVDNNSQNNIPEGVVVETDNSLTGNAVAASRFEAVPAWYMDIEFILPIDEVYMSLCTDYAIIDSGNVNVEFESCIIRTPVTDGRYHTESIPMTDSIDSLIAVLIDYENPSAPFYTEFMLTPGKPKLEWTEGVSL